MRLPLEQETNFTVWTEVLIQALYLLSYPTTHISLVVKKIEQASFLVRTSVSKNS